MFKFRFILFAVLCVIAAAGIWTTADAEFEGLKVDPQVCENLQRQMDEMSAIATSSMSTEQKMEKIQASWNESWAKMLAGAAEDKETMEMTRQIGATVARIMAMAATAQSQGDQNASPALMQSYDDLKKQSQPFVGMMMMLCPSVKMPRALIGGSK